MEGVEREFDVKDRLVPCPLVLIMKIQESVRSEKSPPRCHRGCRGVQGTSACLPLSPLQEGVRRLVVCAGPTVVMGIQVALACVSFGRVQSEQLTMAERVLGLESQDLHSHPAWKLPRSVSSNKALNLPGLPLFVK